MALKSIICPSKPFFCPKGITTKACGLVSLDPDFFCSSSPSLDCFTASTFSASFTFSAITFLTIASISSFFVIFSGGLAFSFTEDAISSATISSLMLSIFFPSSTSAEVSFPFAVEDKRSLSVSATLLILLSS